jgi:hypothetical protein
MGKSLYLPPRTAVEKRGLDLDPAVITKNTEGNKHSSKGGVNDDKNDGCNSF